MELSVQDFLKTSGVVLDVRSPGEFSQGHIPASLNFPLFSNEERSLIGTAYKQVGKDHAIELGLNIAGPKLSGFVAEAKKMLKESPDGVAKILCFRGGMRSASMALLLKMIGTPTVVLQGGYKSFRRYVLKVLEFTDKQKDYHFKVIGGFTGCGKTALLQDLKIRGEQVLDLECLAGHRGSCFGLVGLPRQSSCEQFENRIAMALLALDPSKPIWVEDESRMIGSCKIPDVMFQKMQQAPVLLLQIPKNERIERLCKDYCSITKEQFIAAVSKLSRRLGSLKVKEINQAIENNQRHAAVEKLLEYYDASYNHSLTQRQTFISY